MGSKVYRTALYKPSKYRAKKTVIDGITFASKKEANRYVMLREMQEKGLISDLRLQVKYELIPKQYTATKECWRACNYIADFVYKCGGVEVVEDSKGMRTPEYKIKRKLMLYLKGIEVQET